MSTTTGALGRAPLDQARENRRRAVSQLERSAFLSQISLIAAMVLLAGIVTLFTTRIALSPMFLVGYAVIGVLTAATVLVEWNSLPRAALLVVPLGNLVGIGLISLSTNNIGFALLDVLPLIWVSLYYRAPAAFVCVVVPTAVQVVHAAMDPQPAGVTITRVVVIPIVLGMVALSVNVSRIRIAAQRALMRRQSEALQHAVALSRRNAQQLNHLLSTFRFGVAAFDRDNRPRFVNDTHRAMRMAIDGEDDGVPFRDVYAEDGFTALLGDDRPMARALRVGDLEETVVWVGAPGGTRLALAISSHRTYDADGDAEGVVVVSRNITAEREAVKARDDLVAMVSHELRTPLTAIIGYLDLAIDGDVDDATRAMLSVAAGNAERLIALSDDFRAAVTGVDNAAALRLRPTSARDVVDESVATFTAAAERRDVTISTEGEDVGMIDADPFRLRQIVDNLVSNAVKYCTAGGRVRVTLSRDESECAIQVRNDSDGLTHEELTRIFDRFYRTRSARNSAADGSGLGLAISNELAARHGGKLSASSVLGESVTVTLTLPTVGRDAG